MLAGASRSDCSSSAAADSDWTSGIRHRGQAPPRRYDRRAGARAATSFITHDSPLITNRFLPPSPPEFASPAHSLDVSVPPCLRASVPHTPHMTTRPDRQTLNDVRLTDSARPQRPWRLCGSPNRRIITPSARNQPKSLISTPHKYETLETLELARLTAGGGCATGRRYLAVTGEQRSAATWATALTVASICARVLNGPTEKRTVPRGVVPMCW